MTDPTPGLSPSSRRSKTLFNVLFASFGYVAIRVVIAPVRIKLLTTLLTKEDYGLLTLVMLTVSFITLISSLGSLEFMLRKIPGREKAFQVVTLRTIMTYFGLLAGGIGLLGGLGLVIWQPEKLGLAPTDVAACGLILLLTVHLTQLVYFLMGRTDYAQSRMLLLLYADAWFLPLLGLMWIVDLTVSFMLWFWVAWLLLSVAVSQVFVRTREVFRQRPSRALLREIVVFGVPLVPMIMGEWIFQVQDRYVLLAFTNLEALANFTLCFNIAWVGVTTGASMLDVLVTEFYKTRNRVNSTDFSVLLRNETLRRSFTLMLRYALVLGLPIVLALWFGGRPIILLLSDAKFADAAGIMKWVAPLPLLYLMVIIAGRTLIAVDRVAIVGAGTLAAAGVHLGLSIFLAPLLAERGVALAGCTAYGLLALYFGVRVRFLAWINWRELRAFRMLLFALVTAAALHVAVQGLPDHNVLPLAAGGLASLAAMFAFGLVHKGDIQHFIETMQAPSEPEEAALQEPFARD